MPRPQNPTRPKLAMRVRPSWRCKSSARPMIMTTWKRPVMRKASSQSSIALHLRALGQPSTAPLQQDDEADDEDELGVEGLAEAQLHGRQRDAGDHPCDDDAAEPPRATDEHDQHDEEELVPAEQRGDR